MNLYRQIIDLHKELTRIKREKFNRRVPFGELFTERDEIARSYGFGEGTTCYDSVIIFGDVKVGKHCWIGPNVILDGSGGLEIGDYCCIGANSQIYSHDTVKKFISQGKADVERTPTRIGSGVFIAPNVLVQKGVTIGDRVVIGAMTFVNRDIPSNSKAVGIPAKISELEDDR